MRLKEGVRLGGNGIGPLFFFFQSKAQRNVYVLYGPQFEDCGLLQTCPKVGGVLYPCMM